MTTIQDLSRTAREAMLSERELNPTDALGRALDAHALIGGVFSDETETRVAGLRELTGFGVLQPYLDDSSIEEIWINQPNELYVARAGGVRREQVELSAESIRTLVFRMLRSTGRRVDRSLPFVDAALPDGSRLHVVIPDITASEWSLNIRKFPAKSYGLADLVAFGSATRAQADYLSEAVRNGQNILISGATHSGKTTILCALLNELDHATRLVSCEETFEIRTHLPDWVAMQTRQPNLEGIGEIPLRRLVKEALRMRPGRLVIGEVREAESLDLLIAMNSGVPGLCTIHANDAQAALTKIRTLPLLAGPNISSDFVSATVAQSIDLIVHCNNLPGTGRRIGAIARVTSDSAGEPKLTEVAL